MRGGPQTRRLFEQQFRTDWIFDVELLARLLAISNADTRSILRNTLCEVPLSRWRDVAGYKVTIWDFFQCVHELALIYWTYLRPGTRAHETRARVSATNTVVGRAEHSSEKRSVA